MSKYSTFVFGAISSFKSHSRGEKKGQRLADGGLGSVSRSAEADISVGGCENQRRQKLPVSLTLVDIIIWSVVMNSVFPLGQGSIFSREVLNSLAGKAGKGKKKRDATAKKQVT